MDGAPAPPCPLHGTRAGTHTRTRTPRTALSYGELSGLSRSSCAGAWRGGQSVPRGCARAALHVPRGGAGPVGRRPSAKLGVCALVAAVRRAAGSASVLRLLPGPRLPDPDSRPLPQLRCAVRPPSRPQTLCRAAGGLLPSRRGRRLSPQKPADWRDGTPPPILLATLEAVNESLWGILLNFGNQVSSDLMPSV